jgi:hypothetical protein
MPLPYIQRPIGRRKLSGIFVAVFPTIKIKPEETGSYKRRTIKWKQGNNLRCNGSKNLRKRRRRKKEKK